MAAQGQSVFDAAGDSGSYDCETATRGGTPYPPQTFWNEVDDPAGNPYVTAVGGTSFFGTYDPGTNANPTYPTATGPNQNEYVWNTLNNCTTQPFIFNGNNIGYCPFGAGGGGPSRVWAAPSWQYGHGVLSSYSQHGRYCSQLSYVLCREVPDVSLNADAGTGYSIYCNDKLDPGCVFADGGAAGWQQIGGTSAAAPLLGAMAALADGYHHRRLGLFNAQLYSIFRLSNAYTKYYHDMIRSTTFTFNATPYTVGTNGAFPQTFNYDMATGIGTPDMANLAIGM